MSDLSNTNAREKSTTEPLKNIVERALSKGFTPEELEYITRTAKPGHEETAIEVALQIG